MQISQELQEPMAAGFFPSRDGTLLHASWAPAKGTLKAGVVLVHGYADHAGRYQGAADRLAARGYAVMTFDMRGHGRAEGARGHCERFSDLVDDLVAACARARTHVREPLFLLAQSHGALVALRALVDPAVELPGVEGAVLSAPFLAVKMRVPAIKTLAARVASKVYPRLALPVGIDPDVFSHDSRIADEYRADPLVHHVATARWYTEMLAAQAHVARNAGRLVVPTFWMLAGDDRIVDSDVARAVYERAGGDKRLLVFDGMYHELLNEVDAADVLTSVQEWLDARLR